jgi:hypothetical protein
MHAAPSGYSPILFRLFRTVGQRAAKPAEYASNVRSLLPGPEPATCALVVGASFRLIETHLAMTVTTPGSRMISVRISEDEYLILQQLCHNQRRHKPYGLQELIQ